MWFCILLGLKGGRKSSWLVQGRDGSMKMFPRVKEGGSSERVNIDSNQLLFSFGGGIRRKFIPPPPSPMRSRQSSWRMPAPPAPPPQNPSWLPSSYICFWSLCSAFIYAFSEGHVHVQITWCILGKPCTLLLLFCVFKVLVKMFISQMF